MQSSVQKWGNSLAIRIPKAIAASARLANGSAVSIELHEGRILIQPEVPKAYSLDDLLKRVSKKNLHQEIPSGKALGREIW